MILITGLRPNSVHAQKDSADIYVLRFYGNADRADRWAAAEAEMWNDRAVEIWGMNYPGFGRSTRGPHGRWPARRTSHRGDARDAAERRQGERCERQGRRTEEPTETLDGVTSIGETRQGRL